MKSKTIAVIGAGPVGAILSAHLSSHGDEVIVIDSWNEHISRIKSSGLHITGVQEMTTRPAHALGSISELNRFDPDFVFICTKACDLDIVIDQLDPRVRRSDAVFVSAQNGIDTEQSLADRIGGARVLRAVINYGGVVTGPGEVRQTFFNPPNYMGWLDKTAAGACREAAEIVSLAGLQMEATPEIGKHVWKKAILNTCTMAIAAVTGMNMKEIVDYPPTGELVEILLSESIATAKAYGFDYGPGFCEMVRDFNKRAGPHKPSMLTDLEKGRKTENGFLIRRIAEYAEKKGVPAPAHRTLANVIDALEARGISARRTAADTGWSVQSA